LLARSLGGLSADGGISWLAMRNRDEVRHVLLPVGGPWIPPLNYKRESKKKKICNTRIRAKNEKINGKEIGVEAEAWDRVARRSRSAQFIST